MVRQYVERNAFQLQGVDSLHKLNCLFCIIASQIKEKFDQNEWKVMEPAFLLLSSNSYSCTGGKKWGDFSVHSQVKYREFSIH